MKVAFVIDDSLDKTDGVQQYILTLGKWLHAEGHEVHYLTGQTERTDIAHIHSLSRNMQVHFNQNRMSTPLPANKRRIRELLEREQYDVLHVQMPYSPFLAARIIRAAPNDTAVVGTFHIIPFSFLERMATKVLRLLVWRSLRRFDKVWSVSSSAQKFARRSFGTSSKVLPNVVNVSAFHVGQKIRKYDDGKINIVFLGRLVARKGCLQLLQAIELLHQEKLLQQARVIICGKGQLRSELEAYVHDNHLSHVVTFVGFIEEHEKPDYLATADIAVFPSLGGESFGIVLIEAMAAKSQVVIGGDNVGYRTVLGDRPGQLIDPSSTEAFAALLKRYIQSRRAREQSFKWQQAAVMRYDVRHVGMLILDGYYQAIAKRRSTGNNKRNET